MRVPRAVLPVLELQVGCNRHTVRSRAVHILAVLVEPLVVVEPRVVVVGTQAEVAVSELVVEGPGVLRLGPGVVDLGMVLLAAAGLHSQAEKQLKKQDENDYV